ncbi:MAG: prepilin-type N-terminal cleavage/methylation domain-containing protein [Oscillospiraceae bacterium]
MKKKGFTLIEVLASLMIMSICGVLTIQCVTAMFTVIKRSTDIKIKSQQSFDILETSDETIIGSTRQEITFTVNGATVTVPVKVLSQGNPDNMTKLVRFENVE